MSAYSSNSMTATAAWSAHSPTASCRAAHARSFWAECYRPLKGGKDVSWKGAKAMMSDTQFLRSLVEFDKDSLSDKQVKDMKVAELRAELRRRGASTDGLKPELQRRLLQMVAKSATASTEASSGGASSGGASSAGGSSGHAFTLTAYNILTGGAPWSDELSPYEEELGPPAVAMWKHRRAKVATALRGTDIAVLVECTNAQREYLASELHLNAAVWALKSGNHDGSAILVDSDQWTTTDTYKARIRSGYSQIVVAARLRSRVDGQELVVVALHLKSGYADSEERRVAEFTAALRKVCAKWPETVTTLPTVVAGDLNSDYTEGYARLVRHVVPNLGKDLPKLRNAAADPLGVGVHRPTYFHFHKSVFDYILLTPTITVLDMQTPKVTTPAPNSSQGSDHFPLRATLAVIG